MTAKAVALEGSAAQQKAFQGYLSDGAEHAAAPAQPASGSPLAIGGRRLRKDLEKGKPAREPQAHAKCGQSSERP